MHRPVHECDVQGIVRVMSGRCPSKWGDLEVWMKFAEEGLVETEWVDRDSVAEVGIHSGEKTVDIKRGSRRTPDDNVRTLCVLREPLHMS